VTCGMVAAYCARPFPTRSSGNRGPGPHGSGRCAHYCRLGLEAGGFGKSDDARPVYAGDYGPFLTKRGASQVAEGVEMVPGKDYVPQQGDVAVFARTAAHIAGHVQIYDGTQWISDFKQARFSPYHEPEPYKIYRFPD
jgi:hypothetical protein